MLIQKYNRSWLIVHFISKYNFLAKNSFIKDNGKANSLMEKVMHKIKILLFKEHLLMDR